MKNLKRSLVTIVTGLALTGCQSGSMNHGANAKNAILFIGDGMGPAQMLSGRLYKGGSFYKMNYEKFEVTGFSKTYSSDNYTTDSAAGATALASGVKSYNGAIGKTDPKWEKSGSSRDLQTLVDLAKAQGKSVGIVTTTRITHATPACYYAHVANRNSESEIAEQVLGSNVDLWIGGGKKFFLPKKSGGKREDGRNIMTLAKEEGKIVVENKDDLFAIKDLSKPVLALMADDHIAYYQTGKSEIRLKEMVQKSIELLSQNPKGYFLMVEGGRIDHAAHINAPEKMMAEMVELDEGIGYAMNTVDLDETLIVLTADHETAGLAISGYGAHDKAKHKAILKKTTPRQHGGRPRSIVTFATGPGGKERTLYPLHSAAHSSVDVAIGAIGPRAMSFAGWMDNVDIAWNIARAMGSEFTNEANLDSKEKLWEIQARARK